MKYKPAPVAFHIFCVALLSAAALFMCGCAGEKREVSRTGFYFDTVITVTLYDPADEGLLDHCFEMAEDYENMLSRTVPGSDVWNINHSDSKPVTVSSDTAKLLQTALSWAELTDGKIDPTIGGVSSLWSFKGKEKAAGGDLPSGQAIREALSHVDYRRVTVDGQKVTLADPEAVIDLGFIAKGYIADRMKSYLLSQKVKSALINLGGNILTLGSRTDGSPFQVGIQKPFAPKGTAAAVLPAADLSVVSSGSYERYFEKDGKIYHHILDTKTGYPVWNNLSSVTVLSASSAEGDALSTACFVLGLKEGMALIESLPDTEAVFITDDGVLHASGGVTLP